MNLIFKKLIQQQQRKKLNHSLEYDDIDEHADFYEEYPGYKIFLFEVCDYTGLEGAICEIEKYILFEWDKNKKQNSNFTVHIGFLMNDRPEIKNELPARLLCSIPGKCTEYETYQTLNGLIRDLRYYDYVPIEAVGEKYFFPFVYTEKEGKTWKNKPALYSLLKNY